MSAWASAAPAIGTGSLDGFAIGALMSGACALAITAPRRARRPSAVRGGAQAAGLFGRARLAWRTGAVGGPSDSRGG